MSNGARLSTRSKRIAVGKAPQFNARAKAILGTSASKTVSKALGKKTVAGLRSATLRSRRVPTFKVGGYSGKLRK